MGIITGIGTIVGLVADFGCSALISNAATTLATKSGNKIFDKVMIGIGGAVLAGMAGEAAQKYITNKTDEINGALENAIHPEYLSDEEVDESEREISE